MLKSHHKKSSELFEPGKLLIQFKQTTPYEEVTKMHTEVSSSIIEHIPELNLSVVSVEPGKEMEYKNKYLSMENVAHVELNYYYFPDYKPNDPLYSKRTQTSAGLQRQWGLRRINPEPAWDIVHGFSPTVKVAVIDTGIDPGHPDLQGKFVDPINFSSSDPTDYTDQFGHGTFVSGIIAAKTDNNRGVAGTSFNTAFVIPIKAGNGGFALSPIIDGIIYAVSKGANIINMSLGGIVYSSIFQSAIDYAWGNGLVIIASAGNDGNEQVHYPAGYNHVLAVSATDRSDTLSSFSDWGVDVGITAPGVEILSTSTTYPTTMGLLPYYDVSDGTSFSAPLVSGVAAMLFAVKPSISNQEVIHTIQQTAEPIERDDDEVYEDEEYRDDENKKEWNSFYGYGLVNAGEAVKQTVEDCSKSDGIGSLYGQVVSKQTGSPVEDAWVTAVRRNKTRRKYITKSYVPTTVDFSSDGMFRLMNLPKGSYRIFINGQEIQTAKVSPGADTFLTLSV